MHVGHLRTTIIGDCLARVLDHLGADVVRHNHLGDWGTQFGMLIQFLDEHPDRPWHARDLSGDDGVPALDALYREARAAFDADPAFADRARARVVALQSGDEATLRVWRDIVAESVRAFDALYRRLGVLLTLDDSVGESFYDPWLPDVVRELTDAGIAVESDGALVVLDPDVTGPDGEPAVLIVRKSDGGYGYDTTDLATLRYRVRDLKADRLLYVVDARQSLHFRLVFAAGAARRLGAGRRRAAPRRVRHRARAGRAAVPDPGRRHRPAGRPAGRRRRPGPRGRRREGPGAAARPSSTCSPRPSASRR